MDNIRGLECIEISAICLGLNREDLQGHDWCEVGRASIDYLQAAPKSIVIQWAMNCIRGLNQQAINQLEDRQGRGQSRYGLTAMQVFIKGFTQNQYNAIRRGAAFKDAMPEAYQAIMREENKQSAYIQGAVCGIVKRLPDDLARFIGQYLDLGAASIVVLTNKAALSSAKLNREYYIATHMTGHKQVQLLGEGNILSHELGGGSLLTY